MDAAFKERAERRRAAMVGGVVASHSELEVADQAFWDQATASERLSAVWQMALDAMTMNSERDASSGFQGPAFGTRRRGG